MTYGPANSQGSYLTVNFDLPVDDNIARDLLVKRERLTAQLLNIKESGQFETRELINAQQWFSVEASPNPQKPRYGYRLVFNRGAIAAGASDTFAHNITGITTFTRIYGTAITATPDFRPIPYSSATAVNLQIEVRCTSTQCIVTNGAAAPAITSYYLVIEYLKT